MNKKYKPRMNFTLIGIMLLITFYMIDSSINNWEEGKEDEPVLISKSTEFSPHIQGVFVHNFKQYPTAEPMAELPFKTVFDKEMTFDDLKGQWVVLNLWATWCPPCIAEMPTLQKLQDKYGGQGIKVVAISLDRQMTSQKLRQFMNRHNFGPVSAYYADGKKAMRLFGMRGLPTTYIINPNGKAVGSIAGEIDWMGDDATKFIESFINKQF